jgi:hypothetical protein
MTVIMSSYRRRPGGGSDPDFVNRFSYHSTGKYVYLFVKRKPNRYVFNGRVAVKRTYTGIEPDKL